MTTKTKRVLVEYRCAGCGAMKLTDRAQLHLRVAPLQCAPCSRKRSMFNKTRRV